MLYHKQLGLPSSIGEIVGKTYYCHFTKHALRACLNDRYGTIVPPRAFTVELDSIVEIETGEHGIEKVVVRLPYKGGFDLVIAFIPDDHFAEVKTCWLNAKSDAHETLDETKYFKLN